VEKDAVPLLPGFQETDLARIQISTRQKMEICGITPECGDVVKVQRSTLNVWQVFGSTHDII